MRLFSFLERAHFVSERFSFARAFVSVVCNALFFVVERACFWTRVFLLDARLFLFVFVERAFFFVFERAFMFLLNARLCLF